MAGRRTCGAVQAKVRQAKYAAQHATTEQNRIRKRLKHVRRNPDDEQTKKLL